MAKIGIQMILGGFLFGIDKAGYEKLSHSTAYRWPAQNRLQRSVAHQFVGQGEDGINIDGHIHPEFRGRMYQLDDLRALSKGGEPLMLTSGTGKVFGRYVVVNIKDDFSYVMDDSRARRVDFSVELKKYGEDGEK